MDASSRQPSPPPCTGTLTQGRCHSWSGCHLARCPPLQATMDHIGRWRSAACACQQVLSEPSEPACCIISRHRTACGLLNFGSDSATGRQAALLDSAATTTQSLRARSRTLAHHRRPLHLQCAAIVQLLGALLAAGRALPRCHAITRVAPARPPLSKRTLQSPNDEYAAPSD